MGSPMSSEPTVAREYAIRLDGLCKDYRIFQQPKHRFLQMLSRRRLYGVHHVLRDVSFTVQRGEVVGILGRNGSGKSTLLQVICGVLKPTAGTISARGNVAALLELGSGFNPEFSGIENIYLNASILGLSRRETEARLEQILEFADIGDFVYQPVKIYSSGMYVRLAFAVASCIDPDILVIDEALAVGDVQFQSKCFRRFQQLVESGRTVLLVSHSTEQVVRHCTRALLIEGGRLIDDGPPREIANQYLDLLLGADERRQPTPTASAKSAVPENECCTAQALENRSGYSRGEYRWGQGGARIVDVTLYDEHNTGHRTTFHTGQRLFIAIRCVFETVTSNVIFGFFIKTPDGVTVFGNSTKNLETHRELQHVNGDTTLHLIFSCDLVLGGGSYLLSVGVSTEIESTVIPIDRRYDCLQFEIINSTGSVGLAELNARCQLSHAERNLSCND